jgi:hypothetical protein
MTQAYFGQGVMRWGTGDAAAEARIQTLRAQELLDEGITADIAEKWRLFYLRVIEETPSNPSAQGRARLMEHARTLLEEGR